MPGFAISAMGQGAPAGVRPRYTYTWQIDRVFGTALPQSPVGAKLPLIYLKDAQSPNWDIEKGEVPGATLKYKFAKSINFNDIKLSWYDTVGLESYVRRWRELVWTPDSGFSTPGTYKTLSVLSFWAFDWTDPVIWFLWNSWPQRIWSDGLTYSNSDLKLVEVNLVYDWAEESSDVKAAKGN